MDFVYCVSLNIYFPLYIIIKYIIFDSHRFLSSVTDTLEDGVTTFIALFDDPEKASSFSFVLENSGELAIGLHNVVGMYLPIFLNIYLYY